jgi:hypothetical protein
LTAPGIPEPVEHEIMKKLVNTYGKTWHTWQYDCHGDLPLGVPQLMMGFTELGQAQESLVKEVEKQIELYRRGAKEKSPRYRSSIGVGGC